MNIKAEVRALLVRLQREPDQNLAVAQFSELPTEAVPRPPRHDLFVVLHDLLSERIGQREVFEPDIEQGEDETDAEFQARLRIRRQAIEITNVEAQDRDIRVDLRWSTTPPRQVVNLVDGDVEYEEGPDDASMQPATVCIRVPQSGWTAYMVVAYRAAVVSTVEPFLGRWFRENTATSSFRLEFSGYVPAGFWDDFLSGGTIKQLEFTRHRLPQDIVDMAPNQSVEESPAGTTKLVITVDRGVFEGAKRFVGDIWDQLRGNTHADNSGVFIYEDEEYDRLRARVEFRGIERTLVVGPEPDSRFAPAFPLEVLRGEDGREEPSSLFHEMVGLLDDVLTD